MADANCNSKSQYFHGHASGTRGTGEKYFSRTYKSWRRMLCRCRAKTGPNYKNYVQKGITVCDRWKTFVNFLEDMGSAQDGVTIDRIDSSRGYKPGNCRWSTMTENVRNRTITKKAEFNGETKSVAEWAEIVGISYNTLRARLDRGWDVVRAFTTPKMSNKESSALGRKSRWEKYKCSL